MKPQTQTAKQMITLGRGKGQRQFDVSLEGQIPDLWHIAQAELDLDCKRAILETWHLAHDMRRALSELTAQRDALLEACKAALLYDDLEACKAALLYDDEGNGAYNGLSKWANMRDALINAIALCEPKEKKASV